MEGSTSIGEATPGTERHRIIGNDHARRTDVDCLERLIRTHHTLQHKGHGDAFAQTIDRAPIDARGDGRPGIPRVHCHTKRFAAGADGALHARPDGFHVRLQVDLIPQGTLRLRGDLVDRITGTIRHHHQGLGGGSAARHCQFSLRVESLLHREGTDENGRKQSLSKKRRGQIHLPRIDHQARPERDAVEGGAIAAGDLRKRQAVQLAPGDGFELLGVEEFLHRRNAPRRLPCQLLGTR